MSEQVGWAWLTVAALVSALASFLSLVVALFRVGPIAVTVGIESFGLFLLAYGWAARRHDRELSKYVLAAGALIMLAGPLLIDMAWSFTPGSP